MKILSLGGAGAVCRYATRDLAEFSDFQIVIGDYNVAAAEKLAAEIDDPRLRLLDNGDYRIDILQDPFLVTRPPAAVVDRHLLECMRPRIQTTSRQCALYPLSLGVHRHDRLSRRDLYHSQHSYASGFGPFRRNRTV